MRDPARVRSRNLVHFREWMIRGLLLLCAAFSILITFTIVAVLFTEASRFFARAEGGALATLLEFVTSSKWSPQYTEDYGIWPLIFGTMLVSVIAMVVALPLGLITAIYLSEYASTQVRSKLKPTLEILAGIPTVVYGYFALRVITPGLIMAHDGFKGFNALSAGLMVGVLCLPTVCSLTEDALQAVPRSLRDAAYGLGGTRFDVSLKVVVPAAMSGIVSAFLLAIARAVGETMIVALAAGSTPQLTMDPRVEIQTMTGFMVQMLGGDVPHGTPEYYSLYAVAAVLFVMTLTLTIVGNIVRKRFREAYQ